MGTDPPEDVYCYAVDVDERKIESYGRDSLPVVQEFCRRPKWPAKLSDQFVANDDWGAGPIVAATPGLANWIGRRMPDFRAALAAGQIELLQH